MNEYINISNNNKVNFIINNKEKYCLSKPMTAFSLKNISTTYNSYISNDIQTSKINEKGNINNTNSDNLKEIFVDDLYHKKNSISNNVVSKTSNDYYKKKNYKKYLNIPISMNFSSNENNNSSSINFKNNTFNIINYNRNINSNSNYDNKIYNKLNIKDLVEITKKRKEIIAEKKKEEKLKKEKFYKEQENLRNMIIGADTGASNNLNNSNIHIEDNLSLCENGVQTSLKIKESHQEEKNDYESNTNTNINNNINTLNYDDPQKRTKNTDMDLVNIGNETEENITPDNTNNNELDFNIENNDAILTSNMNNELQEES